MSFGQLYSVQKTDKDRNKQTTGVNTSTLKMFVLKHKNIKLSTFTTNS